MKTKLRFTATLLAASCFGFLSSAAQAQTSFPEKPVTLVVGFSPGSSIDLVARTVAKNLATKLKQPVIVENKSGAGGNVAAEYIAHAKPDGYTLLVVANSIAISPAIYPDLRFDVTKDLAAIAYVGIGPVIMKVSKSLNINNLGQLVAYAKANPGKLNYGSSGVGGTPHMATVLFDQIAGTQMTHIPYKGGADALAGLLGGQVDLLINPLLGDTQSDRITSIAITGDKRSVLAPDIPTFKELGYPNYNIGVYYGIMGPKAIPQDIVVKINASVNETLADKDIIETLSTRSGIVLDPMTPVQFQDYLNKDIELWKDVVAKNKSAIN